MYKKIFAIITHNGSSDRLEAISKTWLPKLSSENLILFVYGNDGHAVPRREGNKLILAATESWGNLPNKIYELYQYCAKNFDFEYLFKIDDDVCVDPEKLLAYPTQPIDYGGRFNYFSESNVVNYGERFHQTKGYQGNFPSQYANGSLYVLSRRAVEKIISFSKSELEDCRLDPGYEDVMIGKCMESSNDISRPYVFDDWKKNLVRWYFFVPYYLNDLNALEIRNKYHLWSLRILSACVRECFARLRFAMALRTRLKKMFCKV